MRPKKKLIWHNWLCSQIDQIGIGISGYFLDVFTFEKRQNLMLPIYYVDT